MLIQEAETELKVQEFRFRDHLDTRLIREEEIVEPVGNGIIEEGGDSKEPFRDEVNSFHEHFELQIIPEIYCRKVSDGEDKSDHIAYACVVTDPDILKIVALLDIAEGFIALPPRKVDLYDTPYALL